MIDFYNAFISYRHAPLDSEIAERVQRDLERFHVPHAIRRQTGRQKIERIFRDKDELPITSDLSETISDALTKAEYLIVICSPNTCESVWVTKEIEFFLKSHSRDHVLTVLAGGEPEDVIPDILTHDGDKVIEPLSCDYRLSARRARKEELPRLAAALVGCSYDELVRRERAYKMRQLVIVSSLITAAAVAFGVYMIHINRKVNEAYQDALHQQTLNLVREARLHLDKDRRLEALLISTVTVPTEYDPDVPVTPESLSMMADATFAYQGLTQGSVDAVWDYYTGDIIVDYDVNPSGTKLVVMNFMRITMWDTNEHSAVFQLQESFLSAEQVMFIDDDVFVVVARQSIKAYSANDGQELWSYVPGSFYVAPYTVHVTDGGSVVLSTSAGSVILLDRDGNIVNEFILADYLESSYITDVALSSEGDRLAFTAIDNNGKYFAGCYDIASDIVVMSESTDMYAASVAWADDGLIAAAFIPADSIYSDNSGTSYGLEPVTATVYCYDAQYMNLEWTGYHSCTFSNVNSSFIDLGSSGLLGFSCGDRVTAFDITSGTSVYRWDAGDTVVEAGDPDGDGFPVIVTRSGGCVRPVTEGEGSRTMLSYEFQADLISAVINNDSFYIQSDQETIICYQQNVRDDQWEQTADLGESSIIDCLIDDDVIAVMTEYAEYNMQIVLINPADNSVTATVDVGSLYDYSSFELLGVWNGSLYTVATSSDGIYLMSTDVAGGNTEMRQLSQVESASYCAASMQEGCIVYLTGEGAHEGVGLYDIDADEYQEFSVPIDGTYIGMAPVYDRTMNIIYVQSDEDDYIVDVTTGDVTHVGLGLEWGTTSLVYIDPVNEQILVSDSSSIFVLDKTGDKLDEIECDDMMPVGFAVLSDPNYLLVVCIDGTLYIYDSQTRDFLLTVSVNAPEEYVSSASFCRDLENGILYVQMGDVLNGVELSSFTEYICVRNALGYHEASDRYFTRSDNEDSGISVGFFRHYSFEDLVDRVNRDLGYF